MIVYSCEWIDVEHISSDLYVCSPSIIVCWLPLCCSDLTLRITALPDHGWWHGGRSTDNSECVLFPRWLGGNEWIVRNYVFRLRHCNANPNCTRLQVWKLRAFIKMADFSVTAFGFASKLPFLLFLPSVWFLSWSRKDKAWKIPYLQDNSQLFALGSFNEFNINSIVRCTKYYLIPHVMGKFRHQLPMLMSAILHNGHWPVVRVLRHVTKRTRNPQSGDILYRRTFDY